MLQEAYVWLGIMDDNSAFNSISSSKALDNTQFRLINNMQSNLSSLFVHDFKLFSPKSHFYSKCNVKTCTPCAYANSSTFLKLNDFILPIMSNSNCKSKNILYIIHEERREINRNCIIILIPVVTLKEKLGTPII